MKKTQPTRRQAEAVRGRRAFGDSLRGWLQDRGIAAQKRHAERRKAAAAATDAPSRGVDRVPERLRGLAVEPEWVHQHAGHPYTPYVNPDRDLKPGARLRRKGL